MADDCQPYRGPAIFLLFMNICWSGIVAANRGSENPEKGARRPARQRPGEALAEGEI